MVLRRAQSLESYESAQWKRRVERVWYSATKCQHKASIIEEAEDSEIERRCGTFKVDRPAK